MWLGTQIQSSITKQVIFFKPKFQNNLLLQNNFLEILLAND